MSALSKRLLLLGASFITARTARRLKRASGAMAAQHAAFRLLLRGFAPTEQGRQFGLTPALSYERFRAQVPLRTYDQLAPAIERMRRGEADVLWPGQCALYAFTPGTAGQGRRWIPVTDPMRAHFRRAGSASLLYYMARVGHCGVLQGRHLLLGGSTALATIPEAKPFPAYAGEMSGIAALDLPPWVLRHLHEPGSEVAEIADWSARLAAIADRTRTRDITALIGMPHWLLALASVVLRGRDSRPAVADLHSLWPNLECIVHGGAPIGPYQDELRAAAGRPVEFHEVYPTSEGFIAAQDAPAGAGLRLLADAGLFFEFIPLDASLGGLGPTAASRIVPLEGVRPGVDYLLVLTTPGGLCRYVLGDVVRFTSVEPPRLVYVGQAPLALNAFGEQVLERDLTDTLTAVCDRHRWRSVNFHVAPLVANTLTGQKHGRHEWWIELRPGTVATPTGPLLAAELDRELIARNSGYADQRRAGRMEGPLVRLVMPGFFDHWLKHEGQLGGHHKLARSRGDRRIADELAALACFTD